MDADDTIAAEVTRQLLQVRRQHRRELNLLRQEVATLRRLLRASAAKTGGRGARRRRATMNDQGRPMPASKPDGDLRASSTQGYALYAASTQGTGAYCRSFGEGDGLSALSERGGGVTAMSLGGANGVYAQSALGNGIHAVGGAALGNGHAPRPAGVFAEGGAGDGMHATSTSGNGLVAVSESGCAVDGFSAEGTGVRARTASPAGIALEIDGRIRLRGCAIGEVCLPEGEQTLTVLAAAAGPESLILLIPLDDPGEAVRIWVRARSAAKFVIGASDPPRSAITLQYVIIN